MGCSIAWVLYVTSTGALGQGRAIACAQKVVGASVGSVRARALGRSMAWVKYDARASDTSVNTHAQGHSMAWAQWGVSAGVMSVGARTQGRKGRHKQEAVLFRFEQTAIVQKRHLFALVCNMFFDDLCENCCPRVGVWPQAPFSSTS